MMQNKFKYFEVLLLILVWVVLIISPALFNENETLGWHILIGPWPTMLPLFIIFIINRFILVPKFLLKKKNLLYLISVAGLIAAFSLGLFLVTDPPMQRMPRPQMGEHRNPPPHLENRPNRQLPPERGNRPVPPFANLLIFSFLLVGFDTGLIMTFRLAKSEQKRAKLEKENTETQLAFLRNQVSPHFFMNTLNNIHALIDIDTEEAKESVIRLSKLMRHLLYDSEMDKIPIKKEIEFISNYVDLMKLRYSDKVKIKLELPAALPDKSIPPLLFTSFVENAFKHGVSYQQDSFIDIAFKSSNGDLTFEINNSNPHNTKEGPSGIGIVNSRKRLDLLYGDAYKLEIEDSTDKYHVFLNIPI